MMSVPSVPTGINGDQVLADFQACTGIDDIAVALLHLQESEWDLLKAVNRVIPDNSQAFPTERSSSSSGFRFSRAHSGSFPMDQDSESDLHRMEEDDFVVAPSDINNGENHAPAAFTSVRSMPESRSRRNDMNHVGTSSGSASDSKIKSERLKSNSSQKDQEFPPRVTLSSDFLEASAGPSKESNSEGTSNREIRFVVNYNGQNIVMPLAQCETIETLKTLVHAHFEIPPCQQIISGWPSGEPSTNSTRFGSLNLPDEVNLQLTTASSNLAGLNILRTEEDEDRYQLHVRDEMNKESYTISFEGTKTVRGVKEDFSSICEIPVRLQTWTGWPMRASDSMALSVCGLDKPIHNLSLRKQASAQSSSSDVTRKHDGHRVEATDGSESSDVEDLTESYPIEEEFFVPERNASLVRHLISDNVIDEVVGTIQFSENFASRYGACHPMFYHGNLEDAVKEACQRPAKQRKLLAMYLHHDGSVMSNVFCQQVLCNESVVSYMTNNFVVWGWDVTNESNRQLLITSVNRNFGTPGVSTIRSLDRDKYPVIIVVSRVRSATEICNVLSGSNFATVDELMGTLMQSVEVFQSQQRADIREEEERDARERVKREQDEAYQLSLSADRAKDEAKRMIEQQKKMEEQAKKEAEEKEQREREEVARGLPEEPGNDCTESVCVLKCRLPGGKIVSRRFLHSSVIKVLFDFLFSQGFSKDKFKFLTTYPKRDLTTLADTTVMKEMFSAQDTLIVEER
ncbi:unnamed protein product [Orchesella dallaii]|uniref:UBX domain-containing protein n=1 Tax=Orchesella dallaii TaxID=48710 RepID=A0ABP1QL66_9HEXA